MTRRSSIANLIMLTSIATAAGRTAPAADWSGTLEAGTNAAYVTNPQLLAGSSVSDETLLLTVDGSAKMQTETGQLTVTPRFSMTRYDHETALNINTGSLDVNYQGTLERGQWTFEAQGLSDSTVTSERGTTGITNVNQRHDVETASLGYRYSSTEQLSWLLQGLWQGTQYSEAPNFGLTNYNYLSGQFGPQWGFSERVQGSLIFEADQLTPQGGTTQNSYSESVRLTHSLTEQYTWRASFGVSRVAAGNTSSTANVIFEVGASRQTERVQWDVSFRRAVLPIGLGLLAEEDIAALGILVGTSEHTTLNVSFNAIKTDPVIYLNYVVYEGASWGQASAEWRYQFAQHWALSAAYVYGRARNEILGQWGDGSQGRLGILWQSGRL